MLDPITLGALGIGAVCLVLWYRTEQSHRARRTTHTARRLVDMPDDDPKDHSRDHTLPVPVSGGGLPARLVRSLPPHLDEDAVRDCVTDNLKLFRATDSLFGKFMIALRDRYHTQWELEMLERLGQKIEAELHIMQLGVEHTITKHTLHDRVSSGVLDEKLKRGQKERDVQLFEAEAPYVKQHTEMTAEAKALEAENKLLEAKLRNEQLRRRISGTGDAPRERPSEEGAAYERARRERRTQRAAQKGALDEDLEMQERMRREFEAKKRDIEDDVARTPEEKAAAIKRLRLEYGKIFAREY